MLITIEFFALLVLTNITFFTLNSRFENYFYDTLMMKSGAPITYFFSKYLFDVLIHTWALFCMVFIPSFFGLTFGDLWLPGWLWVFANPLFVYALSYHFVRDRKMPAKNLIIGFSTFAFVFIIYIQLFLNAYTATLVLYKVCLGTSILFCWIPSFNLLLAIIAVTQAGNISKLNGESFNDASPIGHYGAEIYILFLALSAVIYSIWLCLCLFDSCIKKPKDSKIQAEEQTYGDKNVLAERKDV